MTHPGGDAMTHPRRDCEDRGLFDLEMAGVATP